MNIQHVEWTLFTVMYLEIGIRLYRALSGPATKRYSHRSCAMMAVVMALGWPLFCTVTTCLMVARIRKK